MGFSFDFTGERNVIVYQAEAGMVLDENIYRLLRSELMEEYILSFETENTSRECRFYYDITGCTNMRAWMGEHGFLEKRKMKKKIEEMQKLLTRNGIPKEMIEQEMQYMFVNDEDEEVRLVCIPLREIHIWKQARKSRRQRITTTSERNSGSAGKWSRLPELYRSGSTEETGNGQPE